MPNDIDSEYRLLGAFVEEPEYILKVSADIFTGERKVLYLAIRDSFMAYGVVSAEGVERYYGKSIPQHVEAARGSKPLPIIDKLSNIAMRRQLEAMTYRVMALTEKHVVDIDEVREATKFTPILPAHDTSLASGVLGFSSDLNHKRSGQYRYIETGLPFLNYMLGGEWPRQALTVVLGQPGGGKTALVCNSILRMGMLERPIASFFASLEMTKPRLISRLIATYQKIDGIKLRNGDVDDVEYEAIGTAVQYIQSLPIYIDDRPGMRVGDIITQMREHKERYDTQVAFIDYLQIITYDDKENQSEALGAIAQQIRNAAVELDMAAVLLAQQNRAFQGLQSILGSGRVGQIADTVFEIKLAAEQNGDYRMASFDFLKNREGPLGSQTVQYFPSILSFT